MLGHIAIADLGGYYAQDEKTGALVDTYVPTSNVPVTAAHAMAVSVPAEDAVFERLFDETYAYAKAEWFAAATSLAYPALVTIGTSSTASGKRTWWYAGVSLRGSSRYFCLDVNETVYWFGAYAPGAGAFEAWTERNNREANMRVGDTTISAAPVEYPESLSTLSSTLSTSLSPKFNRNFYAATLVNAFYNAAWLWTPMRSLTSSATALFEHFNPTLKEL